MLRYTMESIKDNDEGTVYSLFPDDIDYITSDYFNKKDSVFMVFNKENPFLEDLSLYAREKSGYDFVSEIAHRVLCQRK